MLTKVLRLVILKVILMVKLMSIDLRRMDAQREIRILINLTGDSDKIYKFIISEFSHTRMLATAMKKNQISLLAMESLL
jgi:hypothetical protein